MVKRKKEKRKKKKRKNSFFLFPQKGDLAGSRNVARCCAMLSDIVRCVFFKCARTRAMNLFFLSAHLFLKNVPEPVIVYYLVRFAPMVKFQVR